MGPTPAPPKLMPCVRTGLLQHNTKAHARRNGHAENRERVPAHDRQRAPRGGLVLTGFQTYLLTPTRVTRETVFRGAKRSRAAVRIACTNGERPHVGAARVHLARRAAGVPEVHPHLPADLASHGGDRLCNTRPSEGSRRLRWGGAAKLEAHALLSAAGRPWQNGRRCACARPHVG